MPMYLAFVLPLACIDFATCGYFFLCAAAGGVDPDDAFSSIPYERGFAFIHYLQVSLGCSRYCCLFARRYQPQASPDHHDLLV